MKTEKFVPCVIYGRSSDDETMSKDHNSTEQQLYICKGLVEIVSLKKGAEYRVIEELIENDAISGATKKRPKYQVMISLIRQGRVRAIFAKELSRLSRNMGDFCELISLCKEMNTSIYMRNIEYECGNVFAEMMVKQLAVFSEFERNINIDRTKSSIRSRMKNNAIIHGGPVILGFKKDEEKVGTWIPFQKEIDQVVFIFQLFLELSTYASVCRKLNEMGIKTKTNRKFTKESLNSLSFPLSKLIPLSKFFVLFITSKSLILFSFKIDFSTSIKNGNVYLSESFTIALPTGNIEKYSRESLNCKSALISIISWGNCC